MTAPRPREPIPADNDDEEIACIRRRTLDSAGRALRAALVALSRDYLNCGKAACARSRRCRGFACERDRGGAEHVASARPAHRR